MWSTKSVISLLALALLATACKQRTDDEMVVARVYDHELHYDDLVGLVGHGVSAEDSVAIVDNYVNQWVRQTVLLSKAEKNVTDDFSRQLNEYRNSLLIYAYEKQIVDKLIDTNVGDEQIEEYYEAHRSDFQLKNSIVKAVYVSAAKKSPLVPRLQRLVAKSPFAEKEVVELEELASRHALQGYFDAVTWIPFYILQTTVPIKTYNEDLYLKQNRSIVLSDDSLTYFVRILEYKVSDEVSPIELQHDNIKAIILNHRKIEILNKLQTDLLAEAEAGGHVMKKTIK